MKEHISQPSLPAPECKNGARCIFCKTKPGVQKLSEAVFCKTKPGVQKLSEAVFCKTKSGVQKLSATVFCTKPNQKCKN